MNPDGIFGPITARAISMHYKLDPVEASHLLGQCAYESGVFRLMEENLNYSKEALLRVFLRYFDAQQAEYYARKPQMIANRVYANRMGNGDEQSGDGWKHRGQGPLQLTGKNNHKSFADFIGDQNIMKNPSIISEKYAIESALFFFDRDTIFKYCKDVTDETILKVSRAVNLGNPNSRATPNGIKDRIEWTRKINSWL